LELIVGTRRVPAFRSLGIVGFHVAVLVAIATSLRIGVPLVAALGLSAAAGLSFFAWGVLRRAVTGRESLVLIEYVWVAYGAVALFAAASGLGVAPLFDVYSVSVAFFLAFGRAGCTVAGCCHGTPASVGLRYGAGHPVPDRLVGRRLFPVQPIEAAALVVIGLVGAALATVAAGAATVWFLASYAVVRFGCERLRGDRRPQLRGISLPQLMAVVQLGAAVTASEAWLVDGTPGRGTAVGVGMLAVALVAGSALLAVRGRNPLVAPHHLDEIWRFVASVPPDAIGPVTATTTSAGARVAASVHGDGWHVSVSHPRHDPVAVAYAFGCTPTSSNDVVHFLLRTVTDVDGDDDVNHTATGSGPLAEYFTAPRRVPNTA
jgi:hypothetical protein